MAGISISPLELGNLVLACCWAILLSLGNLVLAGQSCRQGTDPQSLGNYKASTIPKALATLQLQSFDTVIRMDRLSIAVNLPRTKSQGFVILRVLVHALARCKKIIYYLRYRYAQIRALDLEY